MKTATTAERLKEIMNIKGMKQVDVLEAAKPFCSKYGVKLGRNDISQYVSGKVNPSQKKLTVLGLAFNVSEAWLMGFDVPMNRGHKNISNVTSLSEYVQIPVLGKVAAGIPMTAVENIIDYEEIPASMAAGGEYVALQIKGHSMEPRMFEGDVVIVRIQPSIDSGEVAVVIVNGNEATVKKIQLRHDGIVLQPFNPSYDPIYYTNEDIESLPIRIFGKVVELRQKY